MEHAIFWKDYKKELPKDGQRIISFSLDLQKRFNDGIIADQFDKAIWDKKRNGDKCDYWIADEDLIALIPK